MTYAYERESLDYQKRPYRHLPVDPYAFLRRQEDDREDERLAASEERARTQGSPRNVANVSEWTAHTEYVKAILQDARNNGFITSGQMTRIYGGITRNRPRNWTVDQSLAWVQGQLESALKATVGNSPPGSTPGEMTPEDLLGQLLLGLTGDGSGGGNGRGPGSLRPAYRAPDRQAVEDGVTGMLVNLVGRTDPGLVSKFTDVYMNADRRNFNSTTKDIDPTAATLEAIRNTAEYKQIHRLRPEQEDERTWISSRRTIAESAGLATHLLDDFAIEQATIAANKEDIAEGAAMRQFQVQGRAPSFLLNEVSNVANAMMSRIAR